MKGNKTHLVLFSQRFTCHNKQQHIGPKTSTPDPAKAMGHEWEVLAEFAAALNLTSTEIKEECSPNQHQQVLYVQIY